MKSLYVFDLDETLFTHDYSILRVYIRDTGGEVVHSFPYREYLRNDYNLPQMADGFTFDFSDFSSSEVFKRSAKPIETVISMMNGYARQPNTTVEILTARRCMDCLPTFVETMAKYMIDTTNIRVIFAGTKQEYGYNIPKRKADIIGTEIVAGMYGRVTMFEDNLYNLREFLKLKTVHPWVKFTAFHVIASEGEVDIRRLEE